jgi:hypothetical protein
MRNKVKINWLNVIFNEEFQYCLDLESLKELSLVSKLAREKLKPSLFKYIEFSAHGFISIFEDSDIIFNEYFKHELFSDIESNTSDDLKIYAIEEGLRDIKYSLNGIKTYVKSFYLYKVDKAGYYLFPIINNFENLTSLLLEDCYLKFCIYSNLGELLPNLVCVEFSDVIFAKLVGDSSSSNDIIFPSGIKRLVFDECDVSTTELTSDTYDFLLGDNIDYSTMSDFVLPKVSIPSLIELIFYVDGDESDFELDAFLEANPNLESLSIDYFTSDLLKRLKSLRNLELWGELYFNNSTNLINLESLKFLTISIDYDNLYEEIKRMCLLCPNLECLSFYLDDYDDFDDIDDIQNIKNYHQLIERVVVPIVTNLYKLKTLKIEFDNSDDDSDDSYSDEDSLDSSSDEDSQGFSSDDDSYETISDSDSLEGINNDEVNENTTEAERLENASEVRSLELNNPQETIDFTEFSQIEKLYLEIDSDAIYSINFEKYKHLNYIELISTTENINTEKYREKFNRYSDWKIKFGECKIRGYKLIPQL